MPTGPAHAVGIRLMDEQGSDLIDLRLTCREMENLIFW